MPIVAAVQIERRPGRPSLTANTRRQTVSANTARAMINNNDFREELGLGGEKSLVHNSLDQFKATLAKLSHSYTSPQSASVLDSDPDIFDSLPPSLVSFSLKAPGGGVTCPSIQLVAETSSRLLFMSTSWATSVPVFRDMTSSLQVRSQIIITSLSLPLPLSIVYNHYP